MNKALIGGLIGVAVIGYAGAGMYASTVAEEKVDELITQLESTGGNFSYEDVSATPFGVVTVSGLKGVEGKESVRVSELVLEGFDDMSDDYADIKLEAKGLRFDGMRVDDTPDDPMEAIVKHMVNNEGELDVTLAMTMDADDDELRIGTLSIESDDLGAVAFSGGFSGIAKAMIEASEGFNSETPEAGLASLMTISNITFDGLRLTLEDEGMLDMLMEAQAERRSVTVDKVREKLTAEIERSIERSQGIEKQIAEGALVLFDGDGVSVTLDEPFTLSIADFMGSSRALQRKMADIKVSVDAL